MAGGRDRRHDAGLRSVGGCSRRDLCDVGGLVGICAGLAFSVVVSLSNTESLAGTLAAAFRAEAVKVTIAVVLLWLVFAVYKQVVAIAFVGSFAVSILLFGMAFFVREA